VIANATAGINAGTFTLTAALGSLSASSKLTVEAAALTPILHTQSITATENTT